MVKMAVTLASLMHISAPLRLKIQPSRLAQMKALGFGGAILQNPGASKD